MKHDVKSFGRLLLIGVLSMGLAGVAWSGCFETKSTGASKFEACNGLGGSISTQYNPDQDEWCRYSANPLAGCSEWGFPEQKKTTNWNTPGCTGGISGTSGWYPSGVTATGASTYDC